MKKTGIELIKEERERQIKVEGYTPENDACYVDGELADAAAVYALSKDIKEIIINKCGNDLYNYLWPFDLESYKPTPNNRIKELTKAGALIAAEIDRLI